jgi:hypothetical protein
MNHLYDISASETVEKLFEQIEKDYIVPKNDKPRILKHLKEYFWLKENDTPSTVTAKWDDISMLLHKLNMKV